MYMCVKRGQWGRFQTFSQEESISRLWMLWSTSTSPNWEKHTFIVLEDLVSHCVWNFIAVEPSTEGFSPSLKFLVIIQDASDTWDSLSTSSLTMIASTWKGSRSSWEQRSSPSQASSTRACMWQNITVRAGKKSSHEPVSKTFTTSVTTGALVLKAALVSPQISPSSIPPCSFFYPLSWSFFMYSFCLPRLDATIRNVCFDGLLFMRWGLRAASPRSEDTSTGRKAWDWGQRKPVHNLSNAQPVPTDQRMTPSISTFCFRSLTQFLSSALTSSYSHSSKNLISHHLNSRRGPSPSWIHPICLVLSYRRIPNFFFRRGHLVHRSRGLGMRTVWRTFTGSSALLSGW